MVMIDGDQTVPTILRVSDNQTFTLYHQVDGRYRRLGVFVGNQALWLSPGRYRASFDRSTHTIFDVVPDAPMEVIHEK